MSRKLNRRDFMATTAAAGIAAAARPLSAASGPAVIVQGSTRPVVIASGNGHQFKNGGTKTCVETAFEMVMKGQDVLDAVIAGVNIVGSIRSTTASATAACRTPTASCSSTRAACTARRRRLAASARAKTSSWRRCRHVTVMEHTITTCWSARTSRRSRVISASRSSPISTRPTRAPNG